MKEIRRRVISHALNQVASARRLRRRRARPSTRTSTSSSATWAAASRSARTAAGATSTRTTRSTARGRSAPERSGSLPHGQFADLCFSGRYTHAEVKRLIKGAGGLIELLGHVRPPRGRAPHRRRATPRRPRSSTRMAYQVAKAIAALLPAFEGGTLDRVILTGGMARSQRCWSSAFCATSRGCRAASPSTRARTRWWRWPRARCGCSTAGKRPNRTERRLPCTARRA